MFSQNLPRFDLTQAPTAKVVDVNIINGKQAFQQGMLNIKMFSNVINENTSADKQQEEKMQVQEAFIRFSHFENDKRIDWQNRRVLPGTYAAPIDDGLECIKKKDNINSRYALPNSLVIKFIFYIIPEIGTFLKRGIVEPANNYLGGGKEVIFTRGTNNYSVLKTDEIGLDEV